MSLRSTLQRTLLAAALALGGAAGCALEGVEDPGGPGPGTGDDGSGDDGTENPKPLQCSAELSVTGTIAPDGEPPADRQGCWPIGTWTVNVEVTDPGDCDEVPVESEYVYEVTLIDPADPEAGWEYSFPADPDSEFVFMKVTEGGGRCQGGFEHYSADGKQFVLLRPFEDTDNVLAGIGEYELAVNSQL